jgi:hypothetical protein
VQPKDVGWQTYSVISLCVGEAQEDCEAPRARAPAMATSVVDGPRLDLSFSCTAGCDGEPKALYQADGGGALPLRWGWQLRADMVSEIVWSIDVNGQTIAMDRRTVAVPALVRLHASVLPGWLMDRVRGASPAWGLVYIALFDLAAIGSGLGTLFGAERNRRAAAAEPSQDPPTAMTGSGDRRAHRSCHPNEGLTSGRVPAQSARV